MFFVVGSCSLKKVEDIKTTSEIVYSALVFINQLCSNIIIAKVTMNDLMVYHTYAETLRALCNAANSGETFLCPNFDCVTSAMDLCSKKFDYVKLCTKKMEVVIKYCSKISIGMYICTCMYMHIFVFVQCFKYVLCSGYLFCC